jgi:hypothetical protein
MSSAVAKEVKVKSANGSSQKCGTIVGPFPEEKENSEIEVRHSARRWNHQQSGGIAEEQPKRTSANVSSARDFPPSKTLIPIET